MLTLSGCTVHPALQGWEGKTITADAEPTDFVQELKRQVHVKTSISPARQSLVFSGRQLKDGFTLADYNIQTMNTLHLNSCLPSCK